MPLGTPLVHPRMLTSLSLFFPDFVSIYTPPVLMNAHGEVELGPDTEPGVPLTGHQAIPCNLSIDKGLNAMAGEERTANTTYTSQLNHCQLNGLYTDIREDMRAQINGVVYDIRGVVHSSIGSHTKLMLELRR